MDLILKLVPFYFFIGLGVVAGRFLRLPREPISQVLIYLLVPMVVLTALLRAPGIAETWALPLMYWGLSSLIATLFYRGLWKMKGSTHNLFSFGAGNANTGYFGIPVTVALLGGDYVDLAVLVALGLILYENTVGFFITARAHASVSQALRNVLRLPSFYAVALAILWRGLSLPVPGWIWTTGDLARSSYSVLGFLIIGVSLSQVRFHHLDIRYLVGSQTAKFVVWPLITWGVISLSQSLGGLLSERARAVMGVMAFVPMAANTVVFAALLKVEPEKASVAVFLSTLVALVLFALDAPAWLAGL